MHDALFSSSNIISNTKLQALVKICVILGLTIAYTAESILVCLFLCMILCTVIYTHIFCYSDAADKSIYVTSFDSINFHIKSEL